ncbi:MAG: threonine synthase [Eggerthellaceae bacterium]|nr:threonine synthase [Eggerthellaceae bacterium]
MNSYIDTRGKTRSAIPFTQAVVNGLADGGGLYVPQHIPQLSVDEIVGLGDLPYAQRAAYVYKAFQVDLEDDLVDQLMQQAYGDNFDDPRICPVTSLEDDIHVLELWHGPTSAFKDMALQCLPLFFSASAAKLRSQGIIDNRFLILVATSGDTGKAALAGFADAPGIGIAVMYPDGGVSDIQRKQMITQKGRNVMVWAVRGNFDDCQTAAKAVFGDDEFNRMLDEQRHISLSSANSINWGRLLPQIVYYLSGYAELVKAGQVAAGDLIDVCVPTGNFGNILAAWYAKKMGAPIERLICASNENRVLADFINTGTYDISDRPFVLTPSPSMDILVSSNLERQLFELTDRNPQAISTWMDELKNDRTFKVDPQTFARMRADFASDSTDSAQCLATIKRVYQEQGYLLDPHTAVAFDVAERLQGKNPVLVASTAHWAKFGTNVYRALHDIEAGEALPDDVASLTGCQLNSLIEQQTGAGPIPAGLAELDHLSARFEDVIDRDPATVEAAVDSFLDNVELG